MSVAQTPGCSNGMRSRGLSMMLMMLSLFAGAPSAFADTGQQIANQGNNNGVIACATCHGPAGMGNSAAGFPRLAGLNAEYLSKQLRDYQTGSRSNPIMQPIASSLNDAQKLSVSNYYAAQKVSPAPSIGRADRAPQSLGERLAMRGAWDRDIPECVSCHGPGGSGVGAVFPRLAGQHATYLEQQIKAWKQGSRTNDTNQLMAPVARMLTDEESAAVAAYFAQLGSSDATQQTR